MGDTDTQAAEVQEWGFEMVTCSFEEAAYITAELAEPQNQEREFLDRVLDHFGATYDIPDWHQYCLLQTAHSLPELGVVGEAAAQLLKACHAPAPPGTLSRGDRNRGSMGRTPQCQVREMVHTAP